MYRINRTYCVLIQFFIIIYYLENNPKVLLMIKYLVNAE